MLINVPAIKNKYWRYTVATIISLTFLPTLFLLATLIHVGKEICRAVHNLRLKRLVLDDLKRLIKGIKQMYKGDLT